MKLAEITSTLPYSDKYNQDKMNLDWFVSHVEKILSQEEDVDDEEEDDFAPSYLKSIDVKQLANSGKLFATQDWLDDFGGGDPVFPQLHKPVIVEKDGIGFIIDGHHRLDRAFRAGKPQKVYWF